MNFASVAPPVVFGRERSERILVRMKNVPKQNRQKLSVKDVENIRRIIGPLSEDYSDEEIQLWNRHMQAISRILEETYQASTVEELPSIEY